MLNKNKLSTLNISLEARDKLKQAKLDYQSKVNKEFTFIEFCNKTMLAGIDKINGDDKLKKLALKEALKEGDK